MAKELCRSGKGSGSACRAGGGHTAPEVQHHSSAAAITAEGRECRSAGVAPPRGRDVAARHSLRRLYSNAGRSHPAAWQPCAPDFGGGVAAANCGDASTWRGHTQARL
mmetsp:Transcript_50188/g.160670  ORF Transcript_50188/g.160670 Transcript_50188/m.160670 type:complete len:108 (-) Transcript_50188:1092-1415(-)